MKNYLKRSIAYTLSIITVVSYLNLGVCAEDVYSFDLSGDGKIVASYDASKNIITISDGGIVSKNKWIEFSRLISGGNNRNSHKKDNWIIENDIKVIFDENKENSSNSITILNENDKEKKEVRRELNFDDISFAARVEKNTGEHKNNEQYEDVLFLYKKKILKGVAKTQFAPDMKTTKAMLVTVLYRVAGSPNIQLEKSKLIHWYDKPFAWAVSNKLLKAEQISTINNNITFSQLATMLYKYEKKCDNCSDEDALNWLNDLLANSKVDGNLEVSRIDLAKVIASFLRKYSEDK